MLPPAQTLCQNQFCPFSAFEVRHDEQLLDFQILAKTEDSFALKLQETITLGH